ncbi:MAG: histidinol-phosphate transaminase, partial [Candidatus Omnitrophota bacterium]
NPDNPTGSYVTDKELKGFLSMVPDDVLVFLDEAYYEFATAGDYPETLSYALDGKKNVIVSRTFSKAYSLAGLRIGYGITRPELAGVLNKVREPFNVNSLAQAAAIAALDDQKYMKGSVALIEKEKYRLYAFLKKAGMNYVDSQTNFVLIDTGGRPSADVFNFLLKKGVIVREMSGWGLEGFIRVNLGLPEENDIFMESFKAALEAIPVQKRAS